MTDAKQLVNNLNQAIKHGDNGIAYLHVDTAEEIKGILEKYERLTEAGENGLNVFYLAGYEQGEFDAEMKRLDPTKPQPVDEKLIEEIYGEISANVTYDRDGRIDIDENEIKFQLHTLLQSHKPSVTRGEVEIFIGNVPMFDEFPNYLINWLRSKGILIKEE